MAQIGCVAALACGALWPAGAGAAQARARCAVPHGPHVHVRVVRQTATARIWKRTVTHHDAPSRHSWTACLKSADRDIVLARGDDSADDGKQVVDAALAGTFVAYGTDQKAGLGSAYASIDVRDLRTGHFVFGHDAVIPVDSLAYFDSVVLRADGSVAWIAWQVLDRPQGATFLYDVWKHDACGTTRLDQVELRDVGNGLDKLRLRGDGTISWRNGTMTKTATLQGRATVCR